MIGDSRDRRYRRASAGMPARNIPAGAAGTRAIMPRGLEDRRSLEDMMRSFLGIAPYTSQLHVTERYRPRDFGHMEVQVVADDPGTLSKPGTLNIVWDLAPDQELLEYLCTENIKNMHLDWNDATAAR
jgi:hypothetical protein